GRRAAVGGPAPHPCRARRDPSLPGAGRAGAGGGSGRGVVPRASVTEHAASRGAEHAAARSSLGRPQPVLHDTVGQFQLPLVWIVTPHRLPLPLDRATSVWASG